MYTLDTLLLSLAVSRLYRHSANNRQHTCLVSAVTCKLTN